MNVSEKSEEWSFSIDEHMRLTIDRIESNQWKWTSNIFCWKPKQFQFVLLVLLCLFVNRSQHGIVPTHCTKSLYQLNI